ncbi:hypothetical protein KC343_g646 [Hortaea werneckii]|nr:hypothetical protein KC323_g6848 [Hortaea werneckii]KAI6862101.1 hypothetical protein KC338_g6332 [Hortaea werneckii]KAI7200645.1 hypothetical protein KC352_g19604 [Hortaea werneckii]KAI7354507.1 hypothetical protein KC320_g3390 [Hortaea werneckii]KAI7572665.1 hypothetical protein KC317_g553 [Hortaea werneckii]
MAETNDIQTHQENIEAENVAVSNDVQRGPEIINLSDDDETNGENDSNGSNRKELVKLRHSEIIVPNGDEFNGIRKEYKTVFDHQHKALPPDCRLSRTFSDMALAVSSANKKHIMDRHKKEWKNAMNAAGKMLREEKEEMEWFLEEKIHREKDEATFRIKILGGSIQRYREHKRNAELLEKMFEDLKEL